VKRPRSTLPIEGLPDKTPRCPWCDRALRPIVNELDAAGKSVYDPHRVALIVRRVFLRWNAYDDLFCRLSCARQFAVACYRAGYRRTP
jgi:hypothetical protein